MDGELVADLLNGPYGFLVAIAIFAWLASKEIRKARAEDVKAANARADAAEAGQQTEREKRIAAEAQLRADGEAKDRRLYKAREMLIAQGTPTEELP